MISETKLKKYDTDKSSSYMRNYARELGHLRDEPITLLELGIRRGGSLLLWRDLFPNATIIGLDIDDIDVEDGTGRIHVYKGFQQDRVVLDRIVADVAPDGFDVVIDDASHVGKYTAETFWHLFPRHLKPGGIYVLEDWSCGYWPTWADGHAFEGDWASVGLRGGEARTPARAVEASRAELLRRGIRARARSIARSLETRPELRARLERVYLRVEGSSMQRRFKSHDYGMVGLVKQLVDACAVDVILEKDPKRGGSPSQQTIDSVTVNPSQVFVRKVSPVTLPAGAAGAVS